jgi:hypothetical protein
MAAGLAMGLSVFAYPPLLAVDLLTSLGVLMRFRVRGLASFFFTQVVVLFVFLPYFERAGTHLGTAVEYSLTGFAHGGGWRKFELVLRDLVWLDVYPRLIPALAALSMACALRRWKRVSTALLGAFIVLVFAAYETVSFPSTWSFTYFALGGGIFYAMAPRRRRTRELFHLVWLPSVAAGFLTAWTSMSSVANAVIGSWAAGIVSTAFLFRAVPREIRSARLFAPIGVVAGLLFYLFHGAVFYCDGTYVRLTARVSSGPYRGLYTTPEKRHFLEEVTRDIHSFEDPRGRAVFYEFPAGYLITRMGAAAPDSWLRTIARRKDIYVRYYRDHLTPYNLFFAFHLLDDGYPSPVTYDPKDPLLTYIHESHHRIATRDHYEIFRTSSLN